ncbi:MAG: HAD family phosphatase [Lachnoclostridium sp.]|jgi:HAD superfamily hydrolase (TIGR01509 family)|nr:HAD family phosphatase [Lachnoclostridium sp.]
MLTGIKAIIFDLDGTLVDSMWMWETIDIEYLARYGHVLPDWFQSKIDGMSFTETAVYMKRHFDIPETIENMKEEWNRMAWEKYQNEVECKKGSMEFLKYCRENKLKTGIATSNSPELTDLILTKHKMKPFLDSIHTSCEVEKGKPAPDIYLLVAKELNVMPEECLVFEDIIQGIRAGKSAGMKVCAVADDYSRDNEEEKRKLSDFWIDDFRQVPFT